MVAQRISRAKRTVAAAGLDRPGDLATVRRVLYLVFNEGYTGEVDLAAEAIRLTRQLADAAHHAPNQPERDHLLRQAARLNASGQAGSSSNS